MLYLKEAANLREYCRERSGDTLAVVDYLDSNPNDRLVLENLTQSPTGAMYEEQENFWGGEELSIHLRKDIGFYMGQIHDYPRVHAFCMTLGRFVSGPGSMCLRMLDEARRLYIRKVKKLMKEKGERAEGLEDEAFDAMAKYFKDLADNLPELRDKVFEGGLVDRLTDVFNGIVFSQSAIRHYHMVECDNDPGPPSWTHQVCVHTPYGDIEKLEWLQRQPKSYLLLYLQLKNMEGEEDIKNYAQKLFGLGKRSAYTQKQLSVLWDVYKITRDIVRKKKSERGRLGPSKACQKLLVAIERQDDLRVLTGKVSRCFFAWCKGNSFGKHAPPVLREGEWTVVWDAYKKRKADLVALDVEIQALMRS